MSAVAAAAAAADVVVVKAKHNSNKHTHKKVLLSTSMFLVGRPTKTKKRVAPSQDNVVH